MFCRFGPNCHGNWLETQGDGMLLHLPHHKEMFKWPADQELAIEIGKASGQPRGAPSTLQHTMLNVGATMVAGVRGHAEAPD